MNTFLHISQVHSYFVAGRTSIADTMLFLYSKSKFFNECNENLLIQNYVTTVFPHIVAAATILFWIQLVRKLFKFSFLLCNENLNSFLTRWGNYSRRGNYSREETIWGNTVYFFLTKICRVQVAMPQHGKQQVNGADPCTSSNHRWKLFFLR